MPAVNNSGQQQYHPVQEPESPRSRRNRLQRERYAINRAAELARREADRLRREQEEPPAAAPESPRSRRNRLQRERYAINRAAELARREADRLRREQEEPPEPAPESPRSRRNRLHRQRYAINRAGQRRNQVPQRRRQRQPQRQQRQPANPLLERDPDAHHPNWGDFPEVPLHSCGPMNRECRHCGALLFAKEKSSLCCNNGKIRLPAYSQPPQALLELFNGQSPHSDHFLQNIRAYNSAFAFTSFRADMDVLPRNGPYNIRIHGETYHQIGDLAPQEGQRPRFQQIYFYDTEHEIENRMANFDHLRRPVMEIIQNCLNEVSFNFNFAI